VRGFRLLVPLALAGWAVALAGCARGETTAGGRAEVEPSDARPLVVFAEESFYRDRVEAEEVFRGTLVEVAVTEGPNTRALPFRLRREGEELPIYVSGFDPAPLRALLGRTVEIRGKRIDQSAEGYGTELWPSEIRVVGTDREGGVESR